MKLEEEREGEENMIEPEKVQVEDENHHKTNDRNSIDLRVITPSTVAFHSLGALE